MSKVTYDMVDVSGLVDDGFRPASVIAREPGDAWYVRCMTPGDTAPSWEWSLEGASLRVPLVPHLTSGPDPERALAFAFQLGLAVMYEVAGGDEIVRVHLSVGYPVEDLGDRLRFWLGVAFQMRKRPT